MLLRKGIKFGCPCFSFREISVKKILVALWLILSFVFVSCGGASTTIDLTISDYHFEPDTFTVPAGQEITLNIDNQGFVSHQFVIFKFGTDAGGRIGPEDQDNIYWRFEVLPGHADSATFVAPPEPGEYYVTCGILGHLEAGMVGRLIVVADE
jgi:plastocyanin